MGKIFFLKIVYYSYFNIFVETFFCHHLHLGFKEYNMLGRSIISFVQIILVNIWLIFHKKIYEKFMKLNFSGRKDSGQAHFIFVFTIAIF
jgi:hypothetical protein